MINKTFEGEYFLKFNHSHRQLIFEFLIETPRRIKGTHEQPLLVI